MRQPDKHAVMAAAIERLLGDDPGAFSALYVRHIASPLTGGSAHAYAYAMAQRLVRNLEDERVTLAPVPSSGGREGRGRVTDRRLDMRLRANRHGSTEAQP